MPKCNTVVQTENDLFEPEIQPNSPENCQFLTLLRTLKIPKSFVLKFLDKHINLFKEYSPLSPTSHTQRKWTKTQAITISLIKIQITIFNRKTEQ